MKAWSRAVRCGLLWVALASTGLLAQVGSTLSLDGAWETGIDRHYSATTQVPGLAVDASHPSPGPLWYKRTVTLPGGDWKVATLTLKGARFHPKVYVDGALVGEAEGGMAPLEIVLRGDAVKPSATITLEVALRSLNEVDLADASATPPADRWRTNVSSELWDDVTLHVSGAERIVSAVPWTDFAKRTLDVHWAAEGAGMHTSLRAEVVDARGTAVARGEDAKGMVTVRLPAAVKAWSPEHPEVYTLRLSLLEGGRVQDTAVRSWGFKSFTAKDKKFYLNGEPVRMLGGTVVWHRFLRQPQAGDVAFDPAWFKANVTDRIKALGGNTLRWHLGLPPERMLDLCDREGLMVQMEWPFFHAIPASVESMKTQWGPWLDVAMRHPSVMIVHPWNETGDPVALARARTALDSLTPAYPPLVVAHRDTIHIHKYWWSLFENLGLYYDSAEQFDRTIMVDEFGGNYLDWKGEAGGYPSTRESFLRFLGREQTMASRLEFHAEANARVAEYWRRIDAAGILPFAILGSLEDGNAWFLGSLHDPKPMPVWDALAAAWSPVSVSLDVWDRNYVPGQKVTLPLFLFNDSSKEALLQVNVRVVDRASGSLDARVHLMQRVAAHGRKTMSVTLALPDRVGDFRFEAVLENPPAAVKRPVVSSWNVRTIAPKASPALVGMKIAVASDESELRTFLRQNGLVSVALGDPSAKLVVGSSATWAALAKSPSLRKSFGEAIARGASVVLQDVGPRDLGEGYRKQNLGNLEGAPVLHDPYVISAELFGGVRVMFHQLAEPESHIQPAMGEKRLWQGLPVEATWLWNGLRGGLVAPAADMEVSGLSRAALGAQWIARGADETALNATGGYYAYELAGYYGFSAKPHDREAQTKLRDHVKFLVEDAPALKDVVNPNAEIAEIDVAAQLRDAAGAQASSLTALSTCGKNLTRSEIVELTFGGGAGKLILSQALTAGRLARGAAEPGPYGVRYDPAAEQVVLNMLAAGLKGQ